MLFRLVLALGLMASSVVLSSTPSHAQGVGIHRSDVLIIASALTDPSGGAGGGPSPNQPVNPILDPLVTTARQTGQDHEILLDVPDMDPINTGPRAGVQEGIASGANVTIIFLQSAGIKNPTESDVVLVDVSTSPGGAAAGVGLTIRPNTPGASAEYRFTFVAPADLPANSGSITIVLDEDVQLPGVPPASDGPQPAADLSVARSGLPDSGVAGATLSYELRVTNAGPTDANQVTLTESLPAGATLVSVATSRGTCAETGGNITCDIGTIPRSAEVVVSVKVLIDPSAVGTLVVTGSVSGAGPDPNSGNNQVSGSIRVSPQATPTMTPTLAATATPTATPTPTPLPSPTPTAAPPPTTTPTPAPVPTNTPAAPAVPTPASAPSASPTLPGDSLPSEAPLRPRDTRGFCRSGFGSVPFSEGAGNLLLLLAPLAGIFAYRRWRRDA